MPLAVLVELEDCGVLLFGGELLSLMFVRRLKSLVELLSFFKLSVLRSLSLSESVS